MSYIFCSPKLGKGSFFINIGEAENEFDLFQQIWEESHLKGLETLLINNLPLKKDNDGIFYGSSQYLPTKELSSIDEMLDLISKIEEYYDMDKFYRGIPQKEETQLLYDTRDGFFSESFISVEDSLKEKEYKDYLKSINDKYD